MNCDKDSFFQSSKNYELVEPLSDVDFAISPLLLDSWFGKAKKRVILGDTLPNDLLMDGGKLKIFHV